MKSVLTHYCVVRDDLPRGVLAAQLIHAAGESGAGQRGLYAVALVVRGEAELLLVEDRLRFHEVPFRAIREPDPPWCGQLMAIGVVPMARDDRDLRRVLQRLPLLK
jgi:hypothetical protein